MVLRRGGRALCCVGKESEARKCMRRGGEALRRIRREGEPGVGVRRGHKGLRHAPSPRPPHSYHLQVGYFIGMYIWPTPSFFKRFEGVGATWEPESCILCPPTTNEPPRLRIRPMH